MSDAATDGGLLELGGVLQEEVSGAGKGEQLHRHVSVAYEQGVAWRAVAWRPLAKPSSARQIHTHYLLTITPDQQYNQNHCSAIESN